jgi:predicted O-linked N-acetylglucosamine transferase (SPINDLY family)
VKKKHAGRVVSASGQQSTGRTATLTAPVASPSDADRAVAEGIQHHQAGRLAEAEAQYRQALAADAAHAEALHLLGLIAHQCGHHDAAIQLISQAIQGANDRPHYYLHLAAALQASGRLDMAIDCCRHAVRLNPDAPDALNNLGAALYAQGTFDEAIICFQRAVAVQPAYTDAHVNLGMALQAAGRHSLAAASFQAAITLDPSHADAHHALGVALSSQGAPHEAIPCFERAAALQPAHVDAHVNLGAARLSEDSLDLAIAGFQTALALRPDHVGARFLLGNAQVRAERLHEAVASYRAVVQLDPRHLEAHNNLGKILWNLGDQLAAIESFKQVAALQPASRGAHVTLGDLLRTCGRFDDAIASYRHALELDPHDDLAHSGVILALDHHPSGTPEVAFAERRAWNAAHAAALTAAAPPHTNTPDPERPLRVGYVSAYFSKSSNSLALGPILAHDPAQIEVMCYSDVPAPDERTAMFAAQAPVWRNVTGWTNEALAEQVRADRIDILVDLDGHSSGARRLLAFARKPAPIQVSGWSYPTGTGLDAMDALFADEVVIPAHERHWFAEEVISLPSMMCLDRPPSLPNVSPIPSAASGAVTFGCFNQVMKVPPAVLDTWAAIIAAVPDSRMVFKYAGWDSDEMVAAVWAAFGAHGVGPERIDLLGKSSQYEQLATFSAVDIQLDPFPHGGGVTTYEGLLMGVPCVTVLGDRLSGRVSASMLTSIGLSHLIARSVDEYVEIAVRLAGERAWLAQQRATLRECVLASPWVDRESYTRAAEAAYRALWRRWCAKQATALRSVPAP